MADFSSQTDHAQILPRVYDRNAQSLRTIGPDEIENMDQASASITYYGFAPIGTSDVQAAWRIYRREVSPVCAG